MKNLYLIGMMGSGKSVTAEALAKILEKSAVDLDQKIQEKVELTIPEIFKKHGEPFFRLQEAERLRDLSKQQDLIVATGGGVILNPQNVRVMKESGHVILLTGTVETLWSRIQKNKNRPLLHGEDPKEKLAQIYQDRGLLYETAADQAVETDGLKAEEVAQKIKETLETLT